MTFRRAYGHLLMKQENPAVYSRGESSSLPPQSHIVHDIYFHGADGKKILQWGIVDTGATHFIMPRSLAMQLGITMEPTGEVIALQGIDGHRQEVPLYRTAMSTRTQNDGVVTLTHEVIVTESQVMLIGLDFLRKFTWYINNQGLHLIQNNVGASSQD